MESLVHFEYPDRFKPVTMCRVSTLTTTRGVHVSGRGYLNSSDTRRMLTSRASAVGNEFYLGGGLSKFEKVNNHQRLMILQIQPCVVFRYSTTVSSCAGLDSAAITNIDAHRLPRCMNASLRDLQMLLLPNMDNSVVL